VVPRLERIGHSNSIPALIFDIARAMADESEDLDEGGLNDAVKGFLSQAEDDDTTVIW